MTHKVVVGADHAGFELHAAMVAHLRANAIDVIDVGTHSHESVDYPLFAARACQLIQEGEATWGLLICHSGIGMAIAANRFKGIRAVLADKTEMALQARRHNNANVLCIGKMWTDFEALVQIWDTFIHTSFEASERHLRRMDQMG